ncbi:MAG: hypothetical protein IJN43_10275 [Ruminococcus sp.]|nr:hypothetical protein [Ruminococcus sp.]
MRKSFVEVATEHFFSFLSRNQWLCFIVILAFHILHNQDSVAMNTLVSQYIPDTKILTFTNSLMTIICVLVYFYYSFKKFRVLNEDMECLKDIRRFEAKEVLDKLVWLLLVKYGISVLNVCVISKPFFDIFIDGYIHILFFPIFCMLSMLRGIIYMNNKLNSIY